MAWNITVVAALLLALGYIGFLHSQGRRRERALAHTDDVTHIDNRRAFYQSASREFERARRYNHPFTLAYFDADDFRELHDRFGHQLADGVLRLVAETARDAIRASDLVARLGADQFALLLPEAGADAASAVIRKLQQALRQASQLTGTTPMLAVTDGVPRNTVRIPAASRVAAACATMPSVSGIRTPNSSPPRRPTTSAWRTALRVASATSRSTASPVAWPCTSFTFLKSSRSRYITASGRP